MMTANCVFYFIYNENALSTYTTHQRPTQRQATQQQFGTRDEKQKRDNAFTSANVKLKGNEGGIKTRTKGATPHRAPPHRHSHRQQQRRQKMNRHDPPTPQSSTSQTKSFQRPVPRTCKEDRRGSLDEKNRRKWMNESQINNKEPSSFPMTPSMMTIWLIAAKHRASSYLQYIQKKANEQTDGKSD